MYSKGFSHLNTHRGLRKYDIFLPDESHWFTMGILLVGL